MAKLYPPIIEGSLPAFYKSYLSNDLVQSYESQKENLENIVNSKRAKLKEAYEAGILTQLEYTQELKKLQPYEEMIADLDRRLNPGILLKVNFSMNAAVSKAEVAGIVLKMKRLQESVEIFRIGPGNQTIDWDNSTVTFKLGQTESDELKIGNFYKIQIAFENLNGKTGYYSNAGVIKYTAQPILSIQGLDRGEVNLNPSALTGIYSQNGDGMDPTEKVYSYSFNILNEDFSLYATTGEKLHNSEQDDRQNESSDIFYSNFSFEENKRYYIQYAVTTINGIKIATQLYSVQATYDYIPSNILNQYRLVTTLNYDQGIVNVALKSFSGDKYAIGGTFQIIRSSSKDNFKIWYILNRFVMGNYLTDKFYYEDNTVEHGITYQYAIQQFNNSGICSARIYSDKIVANFEDIFLIGDTLQEEAEPSNNITSEGLKKRQLRIRFNPSVSNYKRNLQESKVDTLGNIYPFIFKNGQIQYHSFNISGIITYLSDTEQRFINHALIEKKTEDTVSLLDENVTTERLFRDAVFDWLTNGNLKLFKSPTEGNMIVRLMNVSLSPEKSVGRMIYSFSATAYEMDEYSVDNLIKHQFLNTKVLIYKYRKSDTIKLNKKYLAGNDILRHHPALSIKMVLPENTPIVLQGMPPPNPQDPNSLPIFIVNKTQYYEVSDVEINKIYFQNEQIFDADSPCYITYEYENNHSNTFSLISNLEYKDYPMIEMRGPRTDLLSVFQNKKVAIDAAGPFRFIKIHDYKNVYTTETSIDSVVSEYNAGRPCAYMPNSSTPDTLKNPRFYYRVYNRSNLSVPLGGIIYRENAEIKFQTVSLTSIDNRISINNQPFIDLTNTESYQLDDAIIAHTNPLNDTKTWSKINIGSNIVALFGIKLLVNTYYYENPAPTDQEHTDAQLINARTALDNAVKAYRIARGEIIDGQQGAESLPKVQEKYNAIKVAYNTFIPLLEQALERFEGEM